MCFNTKFYKNQQKSIKFLLIKIIKKYERRKSKSKSESKYKSKRFI